LILAFRPSLAFLCKTILIIPDIPSGLYFALGFVISSIFLIEADGICFNSVKPQCYWVFRQLKHAHFHFLSRKFYHLDLHLQRDITHNLWCGGSAVVRSLPTLITGLFCSMVERSAIISTPLIVWHLLLELWYLDWSIFDLQKVQLF
jgi:hypothetical protein